MKPTSTVSATQLVPDLAAIRTLASGGPVGVTSHGRTELIVLNAHRFAELSASASSPETETFEAKLSIVLETIDTRVVIVNHDLSVQRINRAMRLVLGLSDEPFLGRKLIDLLPPATGRFVIKRMTEVYESGRAAEFDFVSTLNPGRTIHARMVPWPGGIAYFSDDITDRLHSIERSMEFDALRRAFAAFGNRGSGSVARDGAIQTADAGLAAMTGADAGQLEGRRFVSLFDTSARSKIETAMTWSDAKPGVLDVGFLRRGVEIGDARLSLAPYFAHNGSPRYAFCLEEFSAS